MIRINYIFLMIVGIIAMVLVPFSPCVAGWTHVGSYESPDLDPTDDSGGDDYGGWQYHYCDSGTGGGSGGASASGNFWTSAWVSIYVWELGLKEKTRSVGINSSTEGKSYYAWIGGGTSTPLTINWSVDASGLVKCRGFVEDRYCDGGTSVSSSAIAGASTGLNGQYGGYASASGSASTREALIHGSADVFYYAEANGTPYVPEMYGEYRVELLYSIDNVSDTYYTSAGLTQFTARACVGTDSSAYGKAWLTEGDAFVFSTSWDEDPPNMATCSGSASMYVSW